MKPNKLPTVKESIAYIESTGWKFRYIGFSFTHNRVYVFNHAYRGNQYLSTRELRDAFRFGW